MEELLNLHKADVASLGLKQFIVEAGDKDSLKRMQLKILTAMKSLVTEEFLIVGIGRENIHAANHVSKDLQRWIEIIDIRTGQHRIGERFIHVHCQTADGFHRAFKQAKQKAMIMNIIKSNKSKPS